MPKKTVVAANDPLTLEEAKAHLRVTFADDDDLITRLIKAATHDLEKRIQRTLCETTYAEVLPEFTDGGIMLELPPLLSVLSIVYYNTAGTTVTMPVGDYLVDTHNEPGYIYPAPNKVWPETQQRIDAVTITYKAGYLLGGNAPQQRAAVPENLRAWLLIRIGTLYENRESVSFASAPFNITALDALYEPYRVITA